MTSLLSSPTWAHSILDGGKEQSFGPYFVNENTGCLMLLKEIRRDPIGGYTPSPGWQTFSQNDDYTLMIWASVGVLDILQEGNLRRVIVPEGEEDLPIPSSWDDVLNLYIKGEAFFADQDLYLLPRRQFIFNSFNYARAGREPLTVFVGYRGHPHPYPLILTPSVLRDASEDDHTKYTEYKTREVYASNLLREAYWRHERRILQDLETRGILQHHKTIGDTDILDLSYEPDVAKLFALSELTSSGYVAKSWRDKEDYSCVYKVVVRVIGGTSEPIKLQPPYQGTLRLVPFNICPLSSDPIRALNETVDLGSGV